MVGAFSWSHQGDEKLFQQLELPGRSARARAAGADRVVEGLPGSKVTVVTGPSVLSSFVQTMRESGITSMYLPKNAIGCSKAGWLKTKR